jgi:site-specific DNA recombinase
MKPKGYIRVSTLEQANADRASIDMQRDSIIKFSESQGWEVPTEKDFYIDTASGASLDERPALQRLLADISNGKIQAVLVWKTDRLSRSVLHTETIFSEFEKHKVAFKSVTEPIDTTTPFGRAQRQFLSILAEMERQNIKERMVGGRYAKTARDGTNFGSEAPFGYRLENKRYVIVEEEANIVREVFNLYLTLRSIKRVQKDLEHKKIKCRIGWRYNQVKRILNNVKYTGRMKVKGKVYEQKHPAIISDEIFNKVKEILKHNREYRIINWAYKAPGYFLRDVARCGHCKHEMVKNEMPSQRKAGGRLGYYVCASRRKLGRYDCEHKRAHKKEVLENKALSSIFEHIDKLLSDNEYLLKYLNVTSQEEVARIKSQIQSKENYLKNRERARQRYLTALGETDDPDIFTQYEKSKRDIEALKDEIIGLRIVLEKERLKKDDFKVQKKFYKEFRILWEEADDQEKRDMINSLIKIAWVYMNGNIKIEYNF